MYTILRFTDRNFSDKDLTKFIAYLKKNYQSKQIGLDLSNNSITAAGLLSLLSELSDNLISLNLDSNNISKDDFEQNNHAELLDQLTKIKQKSSLKQLCLANNHIKDCAKLFDWVEDLNLSGCGITDDTARALFSSDKIKYLSLENNEITGKAVTSTNSIWSILEDNKTLSQLNLSQNPITLLNNLIKLLNTKIEKIDLCGIYIKDQEIAELINLIQKRFTLAELPRLQINVSECYLSPENYHDLMELQQIISSDKLVSDVFEKVKKSSTRLPLMLSPKTSPEKRIFGGIPKTEGKRKRSRPTF